MHVLVHLGEIDPDVLNFETEHSGAADGLRPFRRRQERLRRNASGVETVAAHLVAFDQYSRHAEGSRGRSADKPPGPAPITQISGVSVFPWPKPVLPGTSIRQCASASARISPPPASARADPARRAPRSAVASEHPLVQTPADNRPPWPRCIRSYEFFCAAIMLSSPAPARAKTMAPGMIPIAVAATNGPRRTPAKAGTRLTRKNGNAGTRRRKSR